MIDRKTEYEAFLRAKIKIERGCGLDVPIEEINPALPEFTRVVVQWALSRGCAAVFAQFGLHKTVTQLEVARQAQMRGARCLEILPLGVRHDFADDARKYFTGQYRLNLQFIQRDAEVEGPDRIYLTNYETVREGKLDLRKFDLINLDEADCLRSFGSKTFGELLFGPAQEVRLRNVFTATPSPNDYQELIAYAHFLGVMDIGEARTRFFKRNSERADDLTLIPHMEEQFWLWVSTWALFLQKPSDLGFSDEGYVLPPMEVAWHEIPSDHSTAGVTKRGQGKLLKDEAIGVVDASREKRHSLDARIDKLLELRKAEPREHRIIWHDLEDERKAIERSTSAISVYGTQDDDAKERAIMGFRDGSIAELAAKPVMLGGGVNFQYHCARAVFLGIGFKFRDFIQAIHRIRRFGQTRPVKIDIIYTEAERKVKEDLLRKWRQHDHQLEVMSGIIREFGLSHSAMKDSLERSLGCSRRSSAGANWTLANDDSVLYAMDLPECSQDMILTSIPFSTQYEYTPSYNDFGHTDDEEHFFAQMDFLTPELLRILKPGRIAAVHVKDRIKPGNMTGLSYPTVSPFHAHTLFHFVRHGFTYMGMITVTTDVVRENNQTYRLGWTEQCKDGTKMGVGMPEYVLLFRKAPSDQSNGYADEPVRKSKEDYTLARWQIDAHAYWRSSGNRLLGPEDFRGLKKRDVYRLWRSYGFANVYDYEQHIRIAEALDEMQVLPTDFGLIPPHTPGEALNTQHPTPNAFVWSDVTRMRTLNSSQAAKGREKHICPLQLDIVDRLIRRYSAEGETVYDPFSGIGTVPKRAVDLGRVGHGSELNPIYFEDSVRYCKAAEEAASIGTLFDLLEIEDHAAMEISE